MSSLSLDSPHIQAFHATRIDSSIFLSRSRNTFKTNRRARMCDKDRNSSRLSTQRFDCSAATFHMKLNVEHRRDMKKNVDKKAAKANQPTAWITADSRQWRRHLMAKTYVNLPNSFQWISVRHSKLHVSAWQLIEQRERDERDEEESGRWFRLAN